MFLSKAEVCPLSGMCQKQPSPGSRFMPQRDAVGALSPLKQRFAPEHRDATAADA